MKKSSLLALVMASGLALTACSGEDADDAADQAGDAADQAQDTAEDASTESEADEEETTGDMSDPACVTFFEEGGPLADRAEDAREAIEGGEITDDASYSEVNLLEQRISDAAGQATDEQVASLLEEINSPFTEVVGAVNNGARDAESGEISLPDIDVEGSEEAQDELQEACQA
ncbi:hypothetical protein [Ornithinicoccus halotolerans]|uniref:hypothetical protein n=1 Tax=Ornithinicoccus halotolerans TaxID=1748220 RepID=UPI001296A2FB|nr:hypothetical protein [Ornithinicoccus halotolerans]